MGISLNRFADFESKEQSLDDLLNEMNIEAILKNTAASKHDIYIYSLDGKNLLQSEIDAIFISVFKKMISWLQESLKKNKYGLEKTDLPKIKAKVEADLKAMIDKTSIEWDTFLPILLKETEFVQYGSQVLDYAVERLVIDCCETGVRPKECIELIEKFRQNIKQEIDMVGLFEKEKQQIMKDVNKIDHLFWIYYDCLAIKEGFKDFIRSVVDEYFQERFKRKHTPDEIRDFVMDNFIDSGSKYGVITKKRLRQILLEDNGVVLDERYADELVYGFVTKIVKERIEGLENGKQTIMI